MIRNSCLIWVLGIRSLATAPLRNRNCLTFDDFKDLKAFQFMTEIINLDSSLLQLESDFYWKAAFLYSKANFGWTMFAAELLAYCKPSTMFRGLGLSLAFKYLRNSLLCLEACGRFLTSQQFGWTLEYGKLTFLHRIPGCS